MNGLNTYVQFAWAIFLTLLILHMLPLNLPIAGIG